MSNNVNNSYLELVADDIDPDDCDYVLLQKLIKLIHVRIDPPIEVPAIGIIRGSISDDFLYPYVLKEDGSGKFQGIQKLVDGTYQSISLNGVANTFALVYGSGASAIDIPKGWELITDTDIQNKYNIGTSPNWKVAAIRYIGI